MVIQDHSRSCILGSVERRLLFDSLSNGTPENIRISLILPETISLLLTIWAYLHSNFRGGLRKRMHFETECEMAVQGHWFWYHSIARMQLPISYQ